MKIFCSECGTEVLKSIKFCPNCGHKINNPNNEKNVLNERGEDKQPEANKTEPNNIIDDKSTRLLNRYNATGNTSIILSILGLILTFVVSISKYTLTETIIGTVIFVPFIAPFYYFGRKLKNSKLDNPEYALKISKGMFIYTILFVIANALLGSIGYLWLVLLYYFYKSFKETTDYLQ